MEKLEKLTQEQEQLMFDTKDWWINKFFSFNEINKEDYEEGIKFIYEDLLGKKMPRIIYCDSWIGCLLAISIMKNSGTSVRASVWDSVWASVRASVWTSVLDSVRDSVGTSVMDSVRASVGDSVLASVRASVGTSVRASIGDSVRASIGDSVRASVRDSVWDSVRDSVGTSVMDSVGASVRDSVGASVRDSVWDSVGASVRDSVWDSVGTSVRDSVGASVRDSVGEYSNYISSYDNFGWTSFYDYFEKIGVLKNDKFSKYKKLILSGVFQSYEYENYVFAIQPPMEIHRQGDMLHNTKGMAVKFKDQSGYYFLNGRSIPSWVFEKFWSDTLIFDDFLKEDNEDIKAGICSLIKEEKGNDELLKFLNARIVDEVVIKHDSGQEETIRLYKTKERYSFLQDHLGNENVEYAWTEMQCPSTKQTYLIDTSSAFNSALDSIKFHRPANVPVDLEYSWKLFNN